MSAPFRPAKAAKTLVIVAACFALLLGIAAGAAIAATRNIRATEDFTDFQPNLPTKILDVKGRLITEFSSDEKREMVSIKDLPRHLIDALVTREDQSFYRHRGFTIKSISRAFVGKLVGKSLGGGSTITQQVAGTLYADRSDYSIRRKLVELWWALQLERRYTKEEILEIYLNRMYMGAGCYGVEAASKFYFGHSAREIGLAESAVLVIQLSSPSKYNPIENPNNARARSREVLDQMARLGYCSKADADAAFDEYWDNFDYTRVATSAFFMRDDKAPWFSEYVRRQLEDMLYGSLDIYKDGFVVNTTLDLDMQAAADLYMKRGIDQVNKEFKASSGLRLSEAEKTYVPIVEMLGLAFDFEELFVSEAKVKGKTLDYFQRRLNPAIDAAALLFGLSDLKAIANASSGKAKTDLEKTTVEGALVTLENETGHVKAIVGGSKFDQSNQLIRATQALLMPGSCFKPLYYSAAIDTRKFTEGSLIYDSPVVFYNEDGTPYIPLNYKGEWKGPVLTWYALAKSMNVPSLKVLDSIGFDAAIDRAASLLDIRDPAEVRRTFPRVYPLGLGVIGVSPIKMARAFAVFGNQGKEVTPIAIRSVEDRNGRIILEPEKDLRTQQKKKGQGIQVVSPQNAAVMVDMLERVVQYGTLQGPSGGGAALSYKGEDGKKYTIPSAGKTGTTQNWADAWTVGFTPYMTTAIWFGFDRPGNSLGVNQSGATIAGDYWSQYMREIHRGLPYKDFARPQTGLVQVSVCSVSGLLPTEFCDEGTTSLLFYEGTEPKKYCDLHQYGAERDRSLLDKLGDQMKLYGDSGAVDSKLNLDIPGLDLGAPSAPPPSVPLPGAATPLPGAASPLPGALAPAAAPSGGSPAGAVPAAPTPAEGAATGLLD
ncbi:MAG TPA: PBP1A family penicillin-binding protein [Spirochaetales bacterium]|nr:PBP1A family penicillin-binding protein [Spirochaetales bacterium]